MHIEALHATVYSNDFIYLARVYICSFPNNKVVSRCYEE